ncbi:MAG: hypothetical protein ACRDTA_05500 [Pseudonocardiaceae bacterium]
MRLRVINRSLIGPVFRAIPVFVLLTSLLLAEDPAAPEDYGQYSLMTQRHAGKFYSGGSLAGQWSWTPQGDESEVVWGDQSKWPPVSAERFIRAGNWVLLDGYGYRGHGTYYVQRVHRELIGDGSCRNLMPLPSEGGRQHYVQWTIPSRAYCLQAWGTVTEQLTGKIIMDFSHTQVWSPPSSCHNTYLGTQTCIRQWESWSDNKESPGAPITRKLERSVLLARGVGMGFVIDQSYPHPWHAELHSEWAW